MVKSDCDLDNNFGEAKVSCILHHWVVQLILVYSWTRPAILVAGKGREGMFLFHLFLHFHSFSSFSPVPYYFISSTISSVSLLSFSGRQHKMIHKGWRVIKLWHKKTLIDLHYGQTKVPPLLENLELTLVLLNPDIPCLCKQCRSRSVGF